MQNGTCPKCGSQQIYARQAWGERNLISHDVGFTTALRIIDYVCGSCGALESYVNRSDLALVHESRTWLSEHNLKRASEAICSRCGSQQIYARQAVGARNLVASGIVLIMDNVCGDCGFVESYVKASDLHEIREAWQPVNKAKRKNEDIARSKNEDAE